MSPLNIVPSFLSVDAKAQITKRQIRFPICANDASIAKFIQQTWQQFKLGCLFYHKHQKTAGMRVERSTMQLL
jgi:hypothetical protein